MTHDELRALCKAATPGPWGTHPDDPWEVQGNLAAYHGDDCEPVCTIRTDDAADATYIAAVSPDVVLGLLDEIARLAPSPSREACCWPCFKDLNQSDGVADLYAEREDEYVAACGICGHDMEG